MQGRVACEITTCDSIVVTELVFENVLTPLEPAEIVALLSALVFQDKTQAKVKLTPALEAGVKAMQAIATRIAEAQVSCAVIPPRTCARYPCDLHTFTHTYTHSHTHTHTHTHTFTHIYIHIHTHIHTACVRACDSGGCVCEDAELWAGGGSARVGMRHALCRHHMCVYGVHTHTHIRKERNRDELPLLFLLFFIFNASSSIRFLVLMFALLCACVCVCRPDGCARGLHCALHHTT